MQTISSTRVQPFGRVVPGRAALRSVVIKAVAKTNSSEPLRSHVVRLGAAGLISLAAITGPAYEVGARPSDFIQSKPSASPGQPTNNDKFPKNPSTSGNQARVDTGAQSNPQDNPNQFSTLQGLPMGPLKDNDDKIPSPLDMGPDPQTVGARK